MTDTASTTTPTALADPSRIGELIAARARIAGNSGLAAGVVALGLALTWFVSLGVTAADEDLAEAAFRGPGLIFPFAAAYIALGAMLIGNAKAARDVPDGPEAERSWCVATILLAVLCVDVLVSLMNTYAFWRAAGAAEETVLNWNTGNTGTIYDGALAWTTFSVVLVVAAAALALVNLMQRNDVRNLVALSTLTQPAEPKTEETAADSE